MTPTNKKSTVFGFDSIVAAVTILLAVILIIDEYNMPKPNIPQVIGPSFLPIAVLAALIFTAALLFLSSIRSKPYKSEDPATAAMTPKISFESYKNIILVVVGLIIYASILIPVGFIISTVFLIMWQTRLFEKGKWIRNLIVSTFFSASVYYIFVHVLEVLLPEGLFGF